MAAAVAAGLKGAYPRGQGSTAGRRPWQEGLFDGDLWQELRRRTSQGSTAERRPRQEGFFDGDLWQEPRLPASAFVVLLVLSCIPGPWQMVLDPIISIVNLFYLAKIGGLLLFGGGLFGYMWYVEATSIEGACPRCGAVQQGSTVEHFQCASCELDLEAKDQKFVRYVKSGAVASSPFERALALGREAATATRGWLRGLSAAVASGTAGEAFQGGVEVVDAEVQWKSGALASSPLERALALGREAATAARGWLQGLSAAVASGTAGEAFQGGVEVVDAEVL